MPNTSPAEVLRREIASVLAAESAHQVPRICARYGLAEGTGQEAFSGKIRYVMNRLQDLSSNQVLKIGQAVQADYQHRELALAVAAVEDIDLPRISNVTRRRLIAALDSIDLPGSLGIIEFLEPVFDLNSIPSPYRSQNSFYFERIIRADIEQHCIANDDWKNSELLGHLGFVSCHQRVVFTLLERLVDPEIRSDADQTVLVRTLNTVLVKDGYSLQISGTVSGTHTYKVRPAGSPGATPADDEISALMGRFDEAGIFALWQKALQRRHTDPDGAITIARTFLERTCKHILDEKGVAYADDADLPKLWGLCAGELNLAPSQHTVDAFRRILGSAQSIVEALGTLRNRIGDSHGQRGRPVRPKPRHAQLAVNLAGSMATFLLATWEEQQARDAPV